MAKSKKSNAVPIQYATKKCPYCSVHLKLMDEKCYSCGSKVGKVNKLGLADKPINWKGYTISFFAWVAFAVYIWWAFLRE